MCCAASLTQSLNSRVFDFTISCCSPCVTVTLLMVSQVVMLHHILKVITLWILNWSSTLQKKKQYLKLNHMSKKLNMFLRSFSLSWNIFLIQGIQTTLPLPSPVSTFQLSIVWLWLWVRCWVCPLFVRLPVCLSVLSLPPSPLSICVLWAADLGENGVVFPPVCCCHPVCMSDCVILRFVSLLPLNLCCSSSCQGCSQRGWGLKRGAFIICRWPWDSGPEAISYQRLGLRTRTFPGIRKDSWRG